MYLIIALLLLHGWAEAADSADPSWPCVRRKVEQLSPELMWPRALTQKSFNPEQEQRIKTLAERLAMRRTTPDEADRLIADFNAGNSSDHDVMGQVFLATLERIDADRRRIVAGIERYAGEQITLAAAIKQDQAQMRKLEQASDPDFDRIDALEAKIDWSRQIYNDREKSLNYICDTPVILEKRAFDLARKLSAF